jgi:hypothetical protein
LPRLPIERGLLGLDSIIAVVLLLVAAYGLLAALT